MVCQLFLSLPLTGQKRLPELRSCRTWDGWRLPYPLGYSLRDIMPCRYHNRSAQCCHRRYRREDYGCYGSPHSRGGCGWARGALRWIEQESVSKTSNDQFIHVRIPLTSSQTRTQCWQTPRLHFPQSDLSLWSTKKKLSWRGQTLGGGWSSRDVWRPLY